MTAKSAVETTPMLILEGHGKDVTPGSLAFSPDGSLLASGGRDHTLRIWDSFSGQQLARHCYLGEVHGVGFGLGGKVVVSGCGDRAVRVCPASRAIKGRKTFRTRVPVQCVAVSPDGRSVAAGGAFSL